MDIANWQLQVGGTGGSPDRKHFAFCNEQFALCNPLTTVPPGRCRCIASAIGFEASTSSQVLELLRSHLSKVALDGAF
ncbi:hypothetical protein RE6C_01941 [Rhodopirellula europaea 6C]|uniref:Uncharacterized protein n=1 Tax=Rhodopirellula europaea 6C TaxID=1263867 RepID=M2B6P0_9BACT|nr:hypothetical protein RE6C_01941 [Rhodopirellula europaea 6C]